ncbi:hypothetical protein MKW98_017035 [Papaver atlanticum]|uniref:Uncharacterized protein n=1 Tax=Papaver atlanticum TaxID=357466 RepID=A0AAD4TKL5_9MAGN|nr:hypothetical protein MKW98_017035 [Papaver atlanticum]
MIGVFPVSYAAEGIDWCLLVQYYLKPYEFYAGKSERGNLLERVRSWYRRHQVSLLKESNSVIFSFSGFVIDPKCVGCVYK